MLKDKILINNSFSNRIKESYIKKKYPEYWEDINKFSVQYNFEKFQWNRKVYHYVFNITSVPMCVCGNECNFRGRVDKIYSKFCSNKCSAKSITKEKRKNSNLKKLGVENVFQLEYVKEKIKSTNLKKWGVDNPNKSELIRKKIKKTCMEKWGVDSYMKTEDFKKKSKDTNLKKYGCEFPSCNNDIKEKIKNVFLKKYGVDNPNKNKEIRQKIEKTNIEKYGYSNPSYSSDIISKIKESIIKHHIDDFYKNEEYIKKWNLSNLKYIGNSKFMYVCDVCGNVEELTYSFIYNRKKWNHNICTKCNPISSSISQIEIEDFIKSLNIKTEFNKMFQKKYEIDIFIPELNIGFEFNGLYWHSDIYKEKNYHILKKNYFKGKSINIYYIWEDDWKYKREIIKSFIRNKLKKNVDKIHARKCNIDNVSRVDAINFLNENHLQGYVYCKYNIGLYYNNQLISLMSFSNRKINSKSEYELVRFCNKLNTTVVGSASKLFKHFIKNNKFEYIVSYSDNSISDGDIYKLLNFKSDEKITVNYYWSDKCKRYHRFNFNKKRLISQGYDENKTEDIIMRERGYLKIWGAGNKRWVYYS